MAEAPVREMSTEEALAAARRLAARVPDAAKAPSHLRAKVLAGVAERLKAEREVFAALICEEVGKPIKEARREVDRAAFTFAWAAGEAPRWGGEWLPLDFDASTEGRMAFVRRAPRGACLFICPFNFPLNLVAHKVAPAIAVGAPFFLKPAPQAPKTAAKLAQAILDAGWPKDWFVAAPCSNETAEALAKDASFRVLSFTGSAKVGWHLKAVCGEKHAVLELGGNAAVVVAADADLPWAAARSAWGAFYYSGQVCISVQRVMVEEAVYDKFKDLFLKNARELVAGDPKDEKTDVAPLIDQRAAERVDAWIQEAAAGGGKVLLGGPRKDCFVPATIVENPPKACKLTCEEAFGPVVTLEKVPDVETALASIAAGQYGLQAGLFTKDLGSVLSAWADVPVGGLIVNDIPSFRSDAMPYGGSKGSGIGREGVRWAMEEFTEPRTLVVKA
ncbi:MAG TPA: aldehyde dehydrogenase family protein [Elusimicrobiota bacterium]|nr:aldehyde dehydrogenase family protein [Elusimicrobiota bacterium]